MPTVRLRAFAKINLGLKILAGRPDGFHEIRTVYQTIALHDRLEIALRQSRRRTSPEINLISNHPGVPQGPENLVYRAAALWSDARDFRGCIEIRLEKRIPPGAGLGGGSSDAAATLIGLERLTGDRLDRATQYGLASRLGSDVPLFLLGGRVVGCGRGEEVYPLEDLPRRLCLVVFPGFPVSTAEAYRSLDASLELSSGAHPEAEPSLPLTKTARRADTRRFGVRSPIAQGLQDYWVPAENDFERFVFARWPELAKLKRRLLRAGAEVASLTGSGSAVYAIFSSARELTKAVGSIRVTPAGWQTFRTRTLPRREYRRLLVMK